MVLFYSLRKEKNYLIFFFDGSDRTPSFLSPATVVVFPVRVLYTVEPATDAPRVVFRYTSHGRRSPVWQTVVDATSVTAAGARAVRTYVRRCRYYCYSRNNNIIKTMLCVYDNKTMVSSGKLFSLKRGGKWYRRSQNAVFRDLRAKTAKNWLG